MGEDSLKVLLILSEQIKNDKTLNKSKHLQDIFNGKETQTQRVDLSNIKQEPSPTEQGNIPKHQMNDI